MIYTLNLININLLLKKKKIKILKNHNSLKVIYALLKDNLIINITSSHCGKYVYVYINYKKSKPVINKLKIINKGNIRNKNKQKIFLQNNIYLLEKNHNIIKYKHNSSGNILCKININN